MGTHLEVERTFAPDVDTELPDMTGLPGVAGISEPQTWHLEATYFDTQGLALTRAGISLRRRTGGEDEGWHLKVPAAVGRLEERLPLSRARLAPPGELRELVLGRTRTAGLEPVANITTTRTVRRLLGVNGTVLAEIADDVVRAESPVADTAPAQWREWEVELVAGDLGLLEAAEELITSAGVPVSAVQSKIVRALAPRLENTPTAERQPPSATGPARLLVLPWLQEQVEELLRQDLVTRRGGASGVHQMRVAGRRLRAALATYRPLLDREVTEPLRDELRWLIGALGGARDAQVAHELLAELVEREAQRTDVTALRRQLAAAHDSAEQEMTDHAAELLGSERYLVLVENLVTLQDVPPWTEAAERAAHDVVLSRVVKDVERLVRRHEEADAWRAPGEEGAYDHATHEVRKAAKRLRYACESVEAIWRKDARRLRRRAKQVTELLGERNDTVLTRAELERLAAEATQAGESAFVHGRLHALEEQHADELTAAYLRHWPKVARRLRAWPEPR